MTNNPNNIRLSACRVRWGGRDLGLTKGGVDVTIKTETKSITCDQFGQSIVNEIIVGRTATIKTPFVETDLDTLYAIIKASGATLTDTGTVASGTITFSSNPVAADTVTINGHVFTFVTTIVTGANGIPTTPDQVLIGATTTVTAANLAATLALSTDPNVLQGIYVGGTGLMTVTFYRSGVLGNSFTLAKSSTGITVSAATLTGGVDGTRNVTMLTGIGTSMITTAQPLVMHPADLADSDQSQDFTVFLAGQSGSISFAYKIDNERVYMVEWTGYPVAATSKLFKFGI